MLLIDGFVEHVLVAWIGDRSNGEVPRPHSSSAAGEFGEVRRPLEFATKRNPYWCVGEVTTTRTLFDLKVLHLLESYALRSHCKPYSGVKARHLIKGHVNPQFNICPSMVGERTRYLQITLTLDVFRCFL
jgi:hypothetical protein